MGLEAVYFSKINNQSHSLFCTQSGLIGHCVCQFLWRESICGYGAIAHPFIRLLVCPSVNRRSV